MSQNMQHETQQMMAEGSAWLENKREEVNALQDQLAEMTEKISRNVPNFSSNYAGVPSTMFMGIEGYVNSIVDTDSIVSTQSDYSSAIELAHISRNSVISGRG